MPFRTHEYGASSGASDGTGDFVATNEGNLMVYPFGSYRITVRLDDQKRFVAVEAVEVGADFVDFQRQAMPRGYHDIEEFYVDE